MDHPSGYGVHRMCVDQGLVERVVPDAEVAGAPVDLVAVDRPALGYVWLGDAEWGNDMRPVRDSRGGWEVLQEDSVRPVWDGSRHGKERHYVPNIARSLNVHR